MDKTTFAEIVTVIEKAFAVTMDAETRKVWWGLLNELDDRSALAACVDVCRTSVYAPKPADIWLRCQKPEAVLVDEAALAWSMILATAEDFHWDSRQILRAMIREDGLGDSEDDIFRALETVGDLEALSEMDYRGRSMARRDFERVYLASKQANQYRKDQAQLAERAIVGGKQAQRLTGPTDAA